MNKITQLILWFLLIILWLSSFNWFTYAQNSKHERNIIMNSKTITTVNKYFNDKNINQKIKNKKFDIKTISFILWNNTININSDWNNPYVDLLSYLKIHKNNNILKQNIISAWNNYWYKYQDIILNKDYNKCINIYNLFNDISNIKILYSKEIKNKWYKFINKIDDKEFWKLIACWYDYIFPNWKKLTTLKTAYIPYRYKNITEVINKNFIKILKPWESFSTVNSVLRNPRYKFVIGKAIVDWKIKDIEAGWTCWISTILYQTIVKHMQMFHIVKRRPHSAWFTYLYGKTLWLDSTIYDMGKSSIDLKFKNKSKTTLILQWYQKKINRYYFRYWITVFSPYLEDSYVKASKVTKIPTEKIHKYLDRKTGKEKEEKITYKCVNNYIYSVKGNTLLRKVKSCYQFLNQHF